MKQLSEMTVSELLQLQSEVTTLIEKKKVEEKTALRQRLEDMAAQAGFSLQDLLQTTTGKKAAPSKDSLGPKRGAKVAAKYRDPVSGATWTGRGLEPKWMKRALAAGKSRADFAI
jgi:DNA-binding protein H-NS